MSLNDPIIVPHKEIDPETLKSVAHDLVLREAGNDLLDIEINDKVIARVIRLLEQGVFELTFDPLTESVGIREKKAENPPSV